MKWIIAFICVSLLPLASLAQEDSVYAWGKKMKIGRASCRERV